MYGSSADFQEYHESRGRVISEDWDDEYIEAALLVASEWIDGVYGEMFCGYPTGGYTQERAWPRTGAYTNTIPSHNFTDSEIPEKVEWAAYEAAWRQAVTPGSLEKDYTPGKYKSVSVEGAVSVDFVLPSGVSEIQMQIGAVDRLLWPLLSSEYGGGISSLSGGVTRA